MMGGRGTTHDHLYRKRGDQYVCLNNWGPCEVPTLAEGVVPPEPYVAGHHQDVSREAYEATDVARNEAAVLGLLRGRPMTAYEMDLALATGDARRSTVSACVSGLWHKKHAIHPLPNEFRRTASGRRAQVYSLGLRCAKCPTGRTA